MEGVANAWADPDWREWADPDASPVGAGTGQRHWLGDAGGVTGAVCGGGAGGGEWGGILAQAGARGGAGEGALSEEEDGWEVVTLVPGALSA